MEAAAPVAPVLLAESPETVGDETLAPAEQQILRSAQHDNSLVSEADNTASATEGNGENATIPLPIAVSGDLKIMPPSTGLPKPRSAENGNALGGLLESIPMTEKTPEPAEESALHGD